MTLSELINQIAVVNLGRTDADTADSAEFSINWLLTEYLPLKGLKPFLKTTNLSTVAHQEYVDMPSDYAGLKIAQLLQSDDYKTMSEADWEDFEVMDEGTPEFKRILPYSGTTPTWRMYLRLIPDDIYTIKIWYYAKQDKLESPADDAVIPILSAIYGDAPIISGATWRTAMSLGLDTDASRWGKIFNGIDLPELISWQGTYHKDGYSRNRPTNNPYK
jgi:hypothetical protein